MLTNHTTSLPRFLLPKRITRSTIPCGPLHQHRIFGPFGLKFYTIDSHGSIRRCDHDGTILKRQRLSKKARLRLKLSEPSSKQPRD